MTDQNATHTDFADKEAQPAPEGQAAQTQDLTTQDSTTETESPAEDIRSLNIDTVFSESRMGAADNGSAGFYRILTDCTFEGATDTTTVFMFYSQNRELSNQVHELLIREGIINDPSKAPTETTAPLGDDVTDVEAKPDTAASAEASHSDLDVDPSVT